MTFKGVLRLPKRYRDHGSPLNMKNRTTFLRLDKLTNIVPTSGPFGNVAMNLVLRRVNKDSHLRAHHFMGQGASIDADADEPIAEQSPRLWVAELTGC